MAASWGIIGKNWGPAAPDANGGREGLVWVERDVMVPGVVYQQPPEGAAMVGWQQDPNDRYRFRLPLHETLWEARSACELRRDLAALPLEAADHDDLPTCLETLDRLSERLLELAEQFHHDQRGLGLLCPENLFFSDNSGQVELLLVDVGFVWDFMLGRPPFWLRDDISWRLLWDRSPREINQLLFRGSSELAGFDLRTIARVFAWLLVGEELGEWNSGGPIERIPFPRVASCTASEVWDIFDRVLRGEIQAADEFRGQLQACGGLSSHFRPPPPPVSTPGPRTPWAALALFCCAVLGMFGWQCLPPAPPPVSRSLLCPDVSGRSELAPHLAALERVLRQIDLGEADLAAAVTVLETLHAVPCPGLHEAASQQERCLAEIRAAVLRRCATHKDRLIVRLRELPYHGPVECQEIRQLRAMVARVLQFAQPEERPSWYVLLARLEREYGCR